MHGLCEEASINSNIRLRSDPQHILKFRVETVELSAATVHGASKLALAGAMAVAGIAIATLDHRDGGLWSLESTQCLKRVCAVQRRHFPVGANPTRQSLQPEAIGAVMEVTKWLKPSISVFFEKGLNVPEGAHHPSS